MAQTHEQLRQAIMGRVYAGYGMRRVFRSSTIRAALSVGSLVWLFSLVSVLNIAKNLLVASSSGSTYSFFVSAFANADAAVLVSCAVLAAAAAWYMADAVRSLVSPLRSDIS